MGKYVVELSDEQVNKFKETFPGVELNSYEETKTEEQPKSE